MIDKKIKEITKNTRSYITKNKTIPASITVGKVKYNYSTLNYIFCRTIIDNEAKLQDKTMLNAPAPTGETLNLNLTKNEYIPIVKTLHNFYTDKGRSPNYVKVKNHKINILVFVDVLSRIVQFLIDNRRLPATVKLDTAILKKNTATKKVSNDAVFNHFVKVFGSVSSFDGALAKIKDKGYGHYFNDYLTNKQVIDNLKSNKSGVRKPNCTDVCQMMWHVAKVLGYDVKLVHVLCKSSGEGHVYLKLRHSKLTGGDWIFRDPACVVSKNGRAVTCVWCSNGKLIDVNPAWFMDTLNK